MLILSRKKDERIFIGEGVVITVVEIRGDKVRLGIQAPDDVAVDREEVRQALRRQGLDDGRRREKGGHS